MYIHSTVSQLVYPSLSIPKSHEASKYMETELTIDGRNGATEAGNKGEGAVVD